MQRDGGGRGGVRWLVVLVLVFLAVDPVLSQATDAATLTRLRQAGKVETEAGVRPHSFLGIPNTPETIPMGCLSKFVTACHVSDSSGGDITGSASNPKWPYNFANSQDMALGGDLNAQLKRTFVGWESIAHSRDDTNIVPRGAIKTLSMPNAFYHCAKRAIQLNPSTIPVSAAVVYARAPAGTATPATTATTPTSPHPGLATLLLPWGTDGARQQDAVASWLGGASMLGGTSPIVGLEADVPVAIAAYGQPRSHTRAVEYCKTKCNHLDGCDHFTYIPSVDDGTLASALASALDLCIFYNGPMAVGAQGEGYSIKPRVDGKISDVDLAANDVACRITNPPEVTSTPVCTWDSTKVGDTKKAKLLACGIYHFPLQHAGYDVSLDACRRACMKTSDLSYPAFQHSTSKLNMRTPSDADPDHAQRCFGILYGGPDLNVKLSSGTINVLPGASTMNSYCGLVTNPHCDFDGLLSPVDTAFEAWRKTNADRNVPEMVLENRECWTKYKYTDVPKTTANVNIYANKRFECLRENKKHVGPPALAVEMNKWSIAHLRIDTFDNDNPSSSCEEELTQLQCFNAVSMLYQGRGTALTFNAGTETTGAYVGCSMRTGATTAGYWNVNLPDVVLVASDELLTSFVKLCHRDPAASATPATPDNQRYEFPNSYVSSADHMSPSGAAPDQPPYLSTSLRYEMNDIAINRHQATPPYLTSQPCPAYSMPFVEWKQPDATVVAETGTEDSDSGCQLRPEYADAIAGTANCVDGYTAGTVDVPSTSCPVGCTQVDALAGTDDCTTNFVTTLTEGVAGTGCDTGCTLENSGIIGGELCTPTPTTETCTATRAFESATMDAFSDMNVYMDENFVGDLGLWWEGSYSDAVIECTARSSCTHLISSWNKELPVPTPIPASGAGAAPSSAPPVDSEMQHGRMWYVCKQAPSTAGTIPPHGPSLSPPTALAPHYDWAIEARSEYFWECPSRVDHAMTLGVSSFPHSTRDYTKAHLAPADAGYYNFERMTIRPDCPLSATSDEHDVCATHFVIIDEESLVATDLYGLPTGFRSTNGLAARVACGDNCLRTNDGPSALSCTAIGRDYTLSGCKACPRNTMYFVDWVSSTPDAAMKSVCTTCPAGKATEVRGGACENVWEIDDIFFTFVTVYTVHTTLFTMLPIWFVFSKLAFLSTVDPSKKLAADDAGTLKFYGAYSLTALLKSIFRFVLLIAALAIMGPCADSYSTVPREAFNTVAIIALVILLSPINWKPMSGPGYLYLGNILSIVLLPLRSIVLLGDGLVMQVLVSIVLLILLIFIINGFGGEIETEATKGQGPSPHICIRNFNMWIGQPSFGMISMIWLFVLGIAAFYIGSAGALIQPNIKTTIKGNAWETLYYPPQPNSGPKQFKVNSYSSLPAVKELLLDRAVADAKAERREKARPVRDKDEPEHAKVPLHQLITQYFYGDKDAEALAESTSEPQGAKAKIATATNKMVEAMRGGQQQSDTEISSVGEANKEWRQDKTDQATGTGRATWESVKDEASTAPDKRPDTLAKGVGLA